EKGVGYSHAGARTVSSKAWSVRRSEPERDLLHLARGHGRVLRLRGVARTAGTARKTGGGRRKAGSARSRFRSELRSAKIWDSFRDAASNGRPALPARDFLGWPSRKIWRVEWPCSYHSRKTSSSRCTG